MPVDELAPFTELGAGAPVVVLYGDDAGEPPVMHELLARECRVLVFDVGDAGVPAAAIHHAAHVAAGEPYTLVATRATSELALEIAATNESDVKSVVLLAPGELADAAARLDVPAMVVLGTEDDVVPTAVGRTFVEANPELYLMFVYKAGHLVERDRPEAVATLLTRFVQHGREWLVNREDTRLSP